MSDYEDAADELGEIIVRADRDRKPLTVDQQLEAVKIRALLSISQELSRIHHGGINPEFDAGS